MSGVRASSARGERPVVIVTGCSSGLGRELARELFARRDLNVVITARSRSIQDLRMEFADSMRFLVRELDITDDEHIYRLVNEIACLWGRVDCVINNAAVCFRAVVEHMDVDAELVQLKTNYLGPMSLIRAVLPIMREQGRGQIVNVSSVSGMLAMPTMGSYSASKHALEGATEALWYEARPFGIDVTLVELGFIRSESYKNVVLSKKAQMSTRLAGPHSEYYRSMAPFIERLMMLSPSSSKGVAKKILKLIGKQSPPLRISATIDVFLFGLLKRLLPDFLLNRILYLMLPGSIRWGKYWKPSVQQETTL